MGCGTRTVGLILVVTLFGVSLGAVHKVGDSIGWTSLGNIDYGKWTSTNTFHVGDSLVFEYNNKFHNVMQVTKEDFQSCNGTSAIASYTSGSDSITLKRPGHYYFLCAVPGHCQAGQKVDVLVKPSSFSPTATPTPTLGSSSPSPSPEAATTNSPLYNNMAPGPGPVSAQSTAFSLASSSRSFALGFILFAICVFDFAF